MSFLFFVLLFSLTFYICFTIYFWTGLKRLKSNQNILEYYPFVSIVVAARNEEFFLPRLLSALAKQDYPVDKLEVIIA
ncbi:MAG: glycosyl transferase, partial [Candidatus Marinimicrobia bacterium]|nr:glycosyl transferase [Candidatus Neomarinimicrobiota bacterium]